MKIKENKGGFVREDEKCDTIAWEGWRKEDIITLSLRRGKYFPK